MSVIHKLSERVEREHLQHLKDSHRIEDRSALGANSVNGTTGPAAGLDFQTLVSGANNVSVKPDVVLEDGSGWEDDVWGSLLNAKEVCIIYCYMFVAPVRGLD